MKLDLKMQMLLSSWWGGDDDLYISGLSRSLDLSMDGIVTRDELDWYRSGHLNVRRANILALRYGESGISNLVSRLHDFTGETNACLRVLSGESCIGITNYLEEMSHTNQEPREGFEL